MKAPARKKRPAAQPKARKYVAASPRPGDLSKRRLAALPEAQRYLPAGYHQEGGHVATMAQVADPKTPTVDGQRLSPEQQKLLTLARIALQKDVKFGTLDGGIVDKERALKEVQAETALGKALVEIERRTMEMVREYAERASLAPVAKRRTTRSSGKVTKRSTAPRRAARRAVRKAVKRTATKRRKRR
jgi:hypothetical protein